MKRTLALLALLLVTAVSYAGEVASTEGDDEFRPLVTSQDVQDNIAQGQEDYLELSAPVRQVPLYVKFDMTEGARHAYVYENGRLIDSYDLMGRDKPLTLGHEWLFDSKGRAFCPFPKTGRFTPSALYFSTNGDLPGSKQFDIELAGAGEMSVHGYDSNLELNGIRPPMWKARDLFNRVRAVSKPEQALGKLQNSPVVFEVVDHSPDIYERRAKCVEQCRQQSVCLTPKLSDLRNATPADLHHFSKTPVNSELPLEFN